MVRLGLWYYSWDENTGRYYSRPRTGTESAGVNDFQNRGFDRVVILDNEGTQTKYSGPGYENGRNDGTEFAMWCTSVVSNIPYYVTVPFFKYTDKNNGRDTNIQNFYGTYWHGWVDGVLSVVDTNRVGFYWSLETFVQEDHVELNFVKELANYIHNKGLEVIWIPSLLGYPASKLRDMEQGKPHNAIPELGEYFDHIFAQPKYYQKDKLVNSEPYTYSELVEIVEYILERGISIEMEADERVLGQGGNCPFSSTECISRTCDYSKAIVDAYLAIVNAVPYRDISPEEILPNRAYYFGVNLEVIDRVREECPRW
ncbi:DUF4855 domain-containing protein [Thermococcus sp.]